MRCNRSLWGFSGLVVTTIAGWLTLGASPALAVEGAELNGSVGIWAPLLPTLRNSSGDSIGTVIGMSGHHRFDGYKTSVEAGIRYGLTDTTEMLGVDALLRDTWDIGDNRLSAGFGYSMMNWNQEAGNHEIDSDYQGAKIVAGWHTMFGRTPVWLDLSLGLYDLNGRYAGDNGGGLVTGEIDEFATTYGFDIKTDFDVRGIPARAVFGVNYLDDFSTWQNGQMGTGDAVVLTGALEFFLY